MIIEGRNVNELYARGREYLNRVGVLQQSRAGDVLAAPSPVVSVYRRPTERVLWDAGRDANPMFHLCEALWMLAGREDAGFLNEFVGDFGSRFAEPGGRLHGAYGARWRSHWGGDQLAAVVARLRRDPLDRRSVIAMWDPAADLVNPLDDENDYEPRDVPCNTHIYPRMRMVNHPTHASMDDSGAISIGIVERWVLDLTICCRSNDVIWGCYGANAVHFSMLQEYLAAAVGVKVGTMYQVSNNWHGYVDALRRHAAPVGIPVQDLYEFGSVAPVPLVTNPEKFLIECGAWCEDPLNFKTFYGNTFLETTATPVARVNALRKSSKSEALQACDLIEAPDWRLACQRWLERRIQKGFVDTVDGRAR